MASPRSAQKIMASVASTNGGAASDPYFVGSRENVVVMVRNEHATNSVDFTFQVSGMTLESAYNSPPGSTDWFDLYNLSNTQLKITVAATKTAAINLSPFGGAWLQVTAASSSAGNAGTASVWVDSIT